MNRLQPILRSVQGLLLSLPLCLLAQEVRADRVVVTGEGAEIRPARPVALSFAKGRAFRILSREGEWVEVEWFVEGNAMRGWIRKSAGRIEGPRFRIVEEKGEIEVRSVPAPPGEEYLLLAEEAGAYRVAFTCLGRTGEGLLEKAKAKKVVEPPKKEEPPGPEPKREENPPEEKARENAATTKASAEREAPARPVPRRILSLPFLLLGATALLLGGACCVRIRADGRRVIRGRYGESDRSAIHLTGERALRLMKRSLSVTLLGALLLLAGVILLLA